MTTETPQGNRSQNDDEIDLVALARNVWSGKFTILAFAFLGALVAVFIVLRSEPIFRSDALLQIEKRSVSLAVPAAMKDLIGEDATSEIASELEIMRSRLVLGEAVKELGLQIVAEPRPLPALGLIPRRLQLPDLELDFLKPYQWGNEHISVLELEVPEPWLAARAADVASSRLILEITGPGTFNVTLPDGSVHSGRTKERMSLEDLGVSLVVGELEGPPGRQFFLNRLTLEASIKNVQRDFSVAETARGSSMLRLTYTDPSPERAERILDAVAQAYVTQNLDRSAAEADKSLSFIDEQLPISQEDVSKAQQALNAYRQQESSVDVNYETQSLLEQATRIEGELNDLALQEEEVRQRYTINHPRYKLLIENRKSLQERLADIEEQTASLPETQKVIFNLTRDLEVAQEAYLQLLNRAQELRVLRASTVGSARIIDKAYSDGLKISPRGSIILGISTLLGGLFGIGLVLLKRMRHRGIKSARDLEQLGLPVFGTLQMVSSAANNRKSKGALPVQVLATPDDLFSEGLRSLRTALHFGMLDAKVNVVQLTSSRPGDGKSFVAVNLAVVLAQAGKKVCLVDGDMRRGYLFRYFGKTRDTVGMSEVLSHQKTLDEALIETPTDGLSVLLSGRYPPNPSELLMGTDFGKLIEDLNKRFDIVLIDSAPVLAVTDPVVIGRSVGTTILVVKHIESDIDEIDAARQTLISAGVKVSGAVLNQYRPDQVKRYGGVAYGDYRYAYNSPGAKSEKKGA